eukprot:TRINITY_DN409_c0_g1_i1.p1 TRINITY_DN409_c0_g1~~TRINITY_DN409_c0_g1_i1.p1  ORF type:complete len:440 (+),score=77.73 TRINITY_DN409_c0_g1_i1:60-1322(+)
MKSLPLMSAALLSLATLAHGGNYAVLVAGSNGYENYRHQADICHAFQILVKGGYRRENIILMSFDDVAWDSGSNPFVGTLFNQPTANGNPGKNVRKNCDPDYKGTNVTVTNFLAVLRGDHKTASGRVLNTTKDDTVFVNFVDHGGVGIVAFPSGELLHATQLQNTLEYMHERRKYKNLAFYMEACEAGSMFQNLPSNLSIYVTTAADAQESSWGTYCPPNDEINGVALGTCLGDLYSVNWMQNADTTDLFKETLEKQYLIVRNLTAKSHVMQYGEVAISTKPAAVFEGHGDTQNVTSVADVELSSVSSRDVMLHLKYYNYLRYPSEGTLAGLLGEVDKRRKADTLFASILESFPPHAVRYTLDKPTLLCLKEFHTAVVVHCGGYTDYSLKYSRIGADLCGYTGNDAARIVGKVAAVCGAV